MRFFLWIACLSLSLAVTAQLPDSLQSDPQDGSFDPFSQDGSQDDEQISAPNAEQEWEPDSQDDSPDDQPNLYQHNEHGRQWGNNTGGGTCQNPSVRVIWSDLSREEQHSWISAYKCLKTRPSVTGLSHSRNLFDDFAVVHIMESKAIHFTAVMIIWHSYFVYVHDKHMRQCGFQGRTPYWNWMTPADSDPWNDPIFDSETGLGGNGYSDISKGMRGGPFANFPVHLWSRHATLIERPHLLFSQWDSDGNEDAVDAEDEDEATAGLAHWRNSQSVRKLLNTPNFDAFRLYVNKPHTSVHVAIGGDMGPNSSPQAPFFYVHHAFLDCIYRRWQSINPSQRYTDYYGNLANADEEEGPFEARLTDVLRMHGLAADVTVADIINAQDGVMCYQCDLGNLLPWAPPQQY